VPRNLRKFAGRVHLWLGLITGLPVLVIALTGCIYAFQDEIQSAVQRYRYVENRGEALLPPSRIAEIADAVLPGKHLHAIMYYDSTRAAKAIYYSYEEHYYFFVYVNPYTGEVLKVKNEFADFFRIVLDGHFYLWLPPETGQPVVASVSLVFLFLLASGMILWWPRNRKSAGSRFRINWQAGWRRKNYDLHSVFGFYISWLALVLVFTGLMWGFLWFRNGVFAVASGGDAFVEYYNPASDTTVVLTAGMPAIDRVWLRMRREYPRADWIEIHPPEDHRASIAANANPDASTYWKTDYRYFDQYTLEELPVDHVWNRLHESTAAEMLMRMNYDIHVGAILGLPGKILAFLVSLTIASLPVTGALIWIGRRKKSRRLYEELQSVGTPGPTGSPELPGLTSALAPEPSPLRRFPDQGNRSGPPAQSTYSSRSTIMKKSSSRGR
jgi:uncharacterized iron-regulated membrane protein